jgi:hypothetical protein
MRPTPPEAVDPAEVAPEGSGAAEAEGQGRGAEPRSAAPRARRRRADRPAEKTNKRGLYLTDAVWDRLQLEAIRRRTTVSAVAGEVLERNLPRLTITREG